MDKPMKQSCIVIMKHYVFDLITCAINFGFVQVLRIEPRASIMLGKLSIMELCL